MQDWDSVSAPVGAQQPAQTERPRVPGIIRGAPAPPSVSDMTSTQNANRGDAQFNYQIQRDALEDHRLTSKEAMEADEVRNTQVKADSAARGQLVRVIGALDALALDADDASGWFETGTSGQFARGFLPGANAGKSLAGDTLTIDANFAFDALSAMREASATGGALGQITERELDLLKASTANISPDLDHTTFLNNVERARQGYLSRLAMLDPEVATRMGYDSAAAEAGFLELSDEYNRSLGNPDAAPPTINRDFVTQPDPTRTPEDIDAIMRKYGGGQ